MITNCAVRGFLALRRNISRPVSSLIPYSKRRWIVVALAPVASCKRLAALPVGAANSTFCPAVCAWCRTRRKIVVLPVPGPPVITVTPPDRACRTACSCSADRLRTLRPAASTIVAGSVSDTSNSSCCLLARANRIISRAVSRSAKCKRGRYTRGAASIVSSVKRPAAARSVTACSQREARTFSCFSTSRMRTGNGKHICPLCMASCS